MNQKEESKQAGQRIVSVIMPVYNEAGHIEAALTSVLNNEVPAGWRLEILVVDGLSTDGTRKVVSELAAQDPRVKLVDNPKRTVPYALNAGLDSAKGEVIIRVDGHAEVAPDYIANCLGELSNHPECGCVGGAIESVGETPAAAAISKAMSSPFGVGNARFRLGGTAGYVDTLAFGAYRREVFERVGKFDEELTRNQDGEFNHRMLRAGYRIWMSPRIRSRYSVRSSFRKLLKQYYQYGYWTVYVNRKHGRVRSWRQLVPATFLLTLAALALAAIWLPPARWGLALLGATYITAALGFASLKSRDIVVVARMILAFPLMHFGYGVGYIEGFTRFIMLRREPSLRKAELSR